MGGPSTAPAQAAPEPADVAVRPDIGAASKSRGSGDDIFAQAASVPSQPANVPKAEEPKKDEKKELIAPAALPQIGQSFSAAKLMMPPVRKKAEASKKPMPALDISKLQEEKEALLRQRAAAQNPKPDKPGFSAISSPSSTGLGSGNMSGADDVAVSSGGAASLYGSPDEEYDPAKPNDYDEFCRRRMRIKAEEEMERRRQEAVSRKSQASAAPEPKEDDFATKMMKKMGHKPGEGLGKEGQGMTTPLIMQKTGAAAGQVVQGQKREAQTSPAAQAAKQAKAAPEVKRPPSRVLLLMNLVGAGEVDEDLQEETAEEAGKYGKVLKCSIQEMKGVPDEQAVRIFLEFSQVEEATKAFTDMNGRYFGGRVVKARFYDADKFAKAELTSND